MGRPPPSGFDHGVPSFGGRKAMRSEMNIGGDGGDRSSVRVHAAPGGQQHFNIFGGEDHSVPKQSHKISSGQAYGQQDPYGGAAPSYSAQPPTGGVQFPSSGEV